MSWQIYIKENKKHLQYYQFFFQLPDVEQGFLPWLMDQVTFELDRSELGRLALDGLLREVVSKRIDVYDALSGVSAESGDTEAQTSIAHPHSAKEGEESSAVLAEKAEDEAAMSTVVRN